MRKFKHVPGEVPPHLFSPAGFVLANPGEEVYEQRSIGDYGAAVSTGEWLR